jgi:hypothetical protein
MATTGARKLGWLGRGAGVAIGLAFLWWSAALIRSGGGFAFLEHTDASSRLAVTTATAGAITPEAAPNLAATFGDVGVAFGVLVALGAAVVLGASVFPYEWWRRRRALRA